MDAPADAHETALGVLEIDGVGNVLHQGAQLGGQLLLQLARAETVEGRLESALQRCFVAKAIFDELNNLRGVATTHRIIGDVYRLLDSLEVDALRFRSLTGWSPSYSIDAGLAATAAWWRMRRAL